MKTRHFHLVSNNSICTTFLQPFCFILHIVYSSSILIKEAWQESSEEQIAALSFLMLDKNKNKVWILNSTYSLPVTWYHYNDLQLYYWCLMSNTLNNTWHWLSAHVGVFLNSVLWITQAWSLNWLNCDSNTNLQEY